MRISDDARENKADFRSKSYIFCEVGSRFKESATYLVFPALPPIGSFNIHDHDTHVLSATHPDTWDSFRKVSGINKTSTADEPFVVCCRFVSSMTSNVVPNSLFRRVPRWNAQHHQTLTSYTTYSFPWIETQKPRQCCTQNPHLGGPTSQSGHRGLVL